MKLEIGTPVTIKKNWISRLIDNGILDNKTEEMFVLAANFPNMAIGSISYISPNDIVCWVEFANGSQCIFSPDDLKTFY